MISWELYVNDNRADGKEIHHNAKLHCFVDNESLCKKYRQKYGDFENYNSGEVAMRPETACKICYNKWKKQFNISR